jgi:membrane associated rhomboid family serine protease
MLYDRPYMRQAPGDEPRTAKASMVTTLMVITIGVFVLQQVLNVFFPGLGHHGSHFFAEWFALSGENFRALKVWTVLSYGLLHDPGVVYFLFIPIPFAHLIFNMLGLFLLGRPVEEMLGRQRFLMLYIGAVLLGGVVFLLANINTYNVVVGASGGVAGIVATFCILQPQRRLMLIPIPIPVKAIWVLWGMLAFTLLGLSGEISATSQSPGIAHSAHLGGILMGFLYVKFLHNRSASWFSGSQNAQPSVELPEWFKRRNNRPIARKVTYTVNRSSSRDELQVEVDRILDKINASGFGSLNESEKQTLDQAKDILR